MKKIIPSKENVKLIGRTILLDNGLWLGLSGSGAAFEFKGKYLSFTLFGDDRADTVAENDRARFAVMVNGKRVTDTIVDSKSREVKVFDEDQSVAAEVQIIKLSESAMSLVGISAFTADDHAVVSPMPEKTKKIEFIGDSITCGYGVDDEDPLHHFSTATEDVTRAYAYLTAQTLEADYSMFSCSGYGIISGYTEGDEKIPEQTIPKYYESLGFSYGSLPCGKLQEQKWDFESFVPQIVVINLGTNDDSYCKGIKERESDYTEHYIDFLKTVRQHNPDAKIVCALGIMGDRLFTALAKAVSRYTALTGDTNVAVYPFDVQDETADGLVADYHPTNKTHRKAAEGFAKFLSKMF